jgi:hypothetical protein
VPGRGKHFVGRPAVLAGGLIRAKDARPVPLFRISRREGGGVFSFRQELLRVGVGDLPGNRVALGGVANPLLGLGVTRRLTDAGGMGVGDLALCAQRCGFGESCGLGAAIGLESLRGGLAGRQFGLLHRQLAAVLGLRIGCSMLEALAGSLGHLRPRLRCRGRHLGLRGGLQLLFVQRFGGAATHLRPILPARSRKIAIFAPLQIGPGVEDRHIFRHLTGGRFLHGGRVVGGAGLRVARIPIRNSFHSSRAARIFVQ